MHTEEYGRRGLPGEEPATVAVFAADHGVHAQRVTRCPQEVTAQMVANILAGGAVVNAFTAQAGALLAVPLVASAVRAARGGALPGSDSRMSALGTAKS